MTAWLLIWGWQGVALAISLSIALHMLPRINAATRYVLWWGAFVALILLGWQLWPGASPHGSIAAAGVAVAPRDPVLAIHVQPLPAWALSLLAMLWTSVALFRLLRIVPGLNALYRLKDDCRPFPRGVEEQLPLWLAARGRRVRLVLCDRLPGASVLGFQDPCIAIPSSLVSKLSAADLDQIILHEYGHVQRRDDWMQLLQALFEAAMWMHPATFLIGRELNLEREVACDDWVIARTGSPRNYAGCLSRIAEQRRAAATAVFAQTLFGGSRDLFRRVDRLSNARRNTDRKPSLPAAAVGALVIGACTMQLRAFPLLTDAFMPSAPGVVSGIPHPFEASEDGRITDAGGSRTPAESHTPDVDAQPATPATRIRVRADSGQRVARPMAGPLNAPGVRVENTQAFPEAKAEDTVISEPPMLRGTRAFAGVYQQPDDSRAEAAVTTPWQVAGNAGVGIGNATRKASVGLANAFTRAGTALARSF